MVLLWLCKGQVARIFTDDPDVTAAVGSVLPVLCIGVVGDGKPKDVKGQAFK